MTATYLAAEGAAHGWLPLALIPAAVVVWALVAIHGPEMRRRLSAERRHRREYRNVTRAGR